MKMVVTLTGRHGYKVIKTGVVKISEKKNRFSLIYENGSAESFNKRTARYSVNDNEKGE